MSLIDSLNSQKISKPEPPKLEKGGLFSTLGVTNASASIANRDLPSGFGDSQYDDINDPIGTIENMNAVRASRQGFWDTGANAVVGGIASGLLTAGETISAILDIPNNIKVAAQRFQDSETIDTVEYNGFSKFFKETKESLLNEYMPIYREEPQKLIDMKDGAFYWESFRSLLDSAIGFGLTGLGAGAAVKGIGGATRAAAIRSARLNGYTNNIAKALNATGKGLQQGTAGRLTSAYITNYGEGKIMALETYENAFEENFNKMKDAWEEANGKPAEGIDLKRIELDAKNTAGKAANDFLLYNKAFMLTDYFQLNTMFKGSMFSRSGAIKEPGLKNFFKSQLSNAPKESFEEIGQNVVQMERMYQSKIDLREKGYDIPETELDQMTLADRAIHFAASEQALLEGAMGAFGGPIQYSITQAPFEDTQAQRKQYVSQQSTIKRTEDYVKTMLDSSIVKDDLIKKAEEDFNIDLAEEAENLQFERVANENFMRGTTQILEDSMQQLLADPNITQEEQAKIQSKLQLLGELEQDYNANLNKSNANYLLHNKAHRRYLEGINKKLLQKKSELNERLAQKINIYNDAFEKSVNYAELTQDELSLEAKTFLYNNEYTDAGNAVKLVDRLKRTDAEIKAVNKAIFDNDNELDELLDTDLVFEAINDIADDITLDTDEKIKELKKISSSLKSEYRTTKSIAKRKIKLLEDALQDAKNNTDVESKGGSEKIKEDKTSNKKQNKKKIPQSVLTEGEVGDPPVDETKIPKDVEDSGLLAIEKLLANAEESGQLNDDDLDTLLAGVQTGQIDSIDQIQDSFLANLTPEQLAEIDAKVAAQENGEMDDYFDSIKSNVNDLEPTHSTDYKGQPKAKPIEKVQPVSDSPQTDIKIMFYDNVMSDEFKEYFNNGKAKEGDVVEYVVTGNASSVDNADIKVVLNGKPQAYTWLFKPKGKGAAATAERSLRKKILANHAKGKKSYGRVKYQYSGEIVSDGVQKNIGDVQGFTGRIMYVDGKGRLKDVNTKELASEYTNVVLTSKDNLPWSGALFMEVRAANGKTIPVKINQRNLNDKEVQLITALYLKALDPANKDKKKNILNARLADLEDGNLFKLLNQEDQDYLEDATVSEALSHLVYEGSNTASNPETQLRLDSGRLRFGKQSFSNREMGNAKAKAAFVLALADFLKNIKSRTVDINKLKNNPSYGDFIIESQILTTDASMDNGSIFQSNQDQAVTNDPLNRYKTKAIYVENTVNTKEGDIDSITSESKFSIEDKVLVVADTNNKGKEGVVDQITQKGMVIVKMDNKKFIFSPESLSLLGKSSNFQQKLEEKKVKEMNKSKNTGKKVSPKATSNKHSAALAALKAKNDNLDKKVKDAKSKRNCK